MENLKHLWHTVFGDAPDIIDSFFETFYAPHLTATEFSDGKLAAAAYVMPAGYLVNGSSREKCAHIYAVAVYPRYRGLGFGVSVTKKAVELAKKAGFTAVILHPADEKLFGFYEKHCGFNTCFSADTKSVPLPLCAALTEAGIEEYRTLREKFLQDIPHVELNRDVLSFFVKCGGKLYAGSHGCAAVESFDGVSHIREYLGDITCVNAFESCNVSSPGSSVATGMIYGENSFENGWIGLTLE